MAFPYLEAEWPGRLAGAQQEIAGLCRTIAERGGEEVRVLVKDRAIERTARTLIGDGRKVQTVQADYDDCWVRDTLPPLGHTGSGLLGALDFRFNGWGGKFAVSADARVGRWWSEAIGATRFETGLVLEGGALESDGQGVFLTTESCVLDPKRNPHADRASVESTLSELVELDRIVWFQRGLQRDHTEGHVDMIARFVMPGVVAGTHPKQGDPDDEVSRQVEQTLTEAGLRWMPLPSPRPLPSMLPANYCNFYIANEAVLVPLYGAREDQDALERLAAMFPSREVIGLPASHLLWGGGAFHCVTQPQPAPG